MLVERKPGEIVYIDWVGDTPDLVTGDVDGELQTAHFFVTTIGVSNYCFVYAFPNEKVDSFLMGTVKALEFYGGIPKILKPDNTKTASIKNTKDVLILNKVYEVYKISIMLLLFLLLLANPIQSHLLKIMFVGLKPTF